MPFAESDASRFPFSSGLELVTFSAVHCVSFIAGFLSFAGTFFISSFHYTPNRFIRNLSSYSPEFGLYPPKRAKLPRTTTNSSAMLPMLITLCYVHCSPSFRKIHKVQRLHKLARLRHSVGFVPVMVFVQRIACLYAEQSHKQLSLNKQKHTPGTTCFQHVCTSSSYVGLLCTEPPSYSQRRAAQRMQ